MAHGFEMKIDVSDGFNDIAATVAATTKQLEIAAYRALVKSGQWLRIHTLRELGQELGIKQTALKDRFRIYPQRVNTEIRFWVGLNPIAVHRIGSPKVTPHGVRVNHTIYDGAFISPMKSDQPLVFRREGHARLPIELVTEGIDDIANEVIDRWERRVFIRFRELFEHEARALVDGFTV
jgi:hypothetical protein